MHLEASSTLSQWLEPTSNKSYYLCFIVANWTKELCGLMGKLQVKAKQTQVNCNTVAIAL
jgi:hypothetical protein